MERKTGTGALRGGMILGIGMDLIEVARVARAFERLGDRFARRFLLGRELEYCLGQARPAAHLAARFAAKEAVAKAFGTGIGSRLGWKDMEIIRSESGQPHVELHGSGLELFNERGGSSIWLSITHTQCHASAMAVLEGCTGGPSTQQGRRPISS